MLEVRVAGFASRLPPTESSVDTLAFVQPLTQDIESVTGESLSQVELKV